MKPRELIGSDTSLGLGDHLQRPSDLPCPESPAMVDLTVFMAERMNHALNLLHPTEPRQAKQRLTRWWFDSGVYLQRSSACEMVRAQLRTIDFDEQAAAIAWFAGSWHDDQRVMLRLLWRIQCSSYIVTGAALLHNIGSKDEEGSRNDRRETACSGR